MFPSRITSGLLKRTPKAAAGYTAVAADFDGTNDYARRGGDLTGNADSKVGLVSLWFNAEGGDGTYRGILASYDTYFAVFLDNSNYLRVTARNSSGTQILYMQSTVTYSAGGGWHHLLAAWDLATGVGQLYSDGVDRLAGSPTLTNNTIDYTRIEWHLGEGSYERLWNGCLSEVYFNNAATLDISNSTNREKFRSAGGLPVDLGSTGATPTGAQPIMYFKNAAASFGTNSGSGGNFTVTGTLDTCGSAP